MSPRRLISRLLLSLALGLLTTIAVALAASLWSPVLSKTRSIAFVECVTAGRLEVSRENTDADALAIAKLAVRRNWSSVEPRPGNGDALALARQSAVGFDAWFCESTWTPYLSHVDIRAGFPFRALSTTGREGFFMPAFGGPTVLAQPPLNGLPVEWDQAWLAPSCAHPLADIGGQPRPLPFHPIPLGLTADTLLFAAAWSALLFAPPAIRRKLRLRRNLCPSCGYNRSGLPPSAPCPECGQPV